MPENVTVSLRATSRRSPGLLTRRLPGLPEVAPASPAKPAPEAGEQVRDDPAGLDLDLRAAELSLKLDPVRVAGKPGINSVSR